MSDTIETVGQENGEAVLEKVTIEHANGTGHFVDGQTEPTGVPFHETLSQLDVPADQVSNAPNIPDGTLSGINLAEALISSRFAVLVDGKFTVTLVRNDTGTDYDETLSVPLVDFVGLSVRALGKLQVAADPKRKAKEAAEKFLTKHAELTEEDLIEMLRLAREKGLSPEG